MIEIGSLVRSIDDGTIGIVVRSYKTEVSRDPENEGLSELRMLYRIIWADAHKGIHYEEELEVII